MEHKEYLSKLHHEMLDILDEIVRVCDNLKINYYLTGGTLLGAVRHKGFIPWDDDLDIVMKRSDFEIFINNAPKCLDSNYYLSWITTDKKYFRLYAKICKKNTAFTETIGNNVSTFGIFVDVFPIDYSKGNRSKIRNNKRIVKTIGNMLNEKRAMSYYSGIKKVIINHLSEKFLFKTANRIMQSENHCSDIMYYVNYSSQYPINRWTINCSYFGDGCQIQFEDRLYNAPSEFHKVLETIYGKNYLEIPPLNKRKTHYPLSVKFSDGTVINFEYKQDKLTINDTIDD